MRYFNTAGPCVPELHYMVPAEPRLPEARSLIEEGHFFVVHAPRQTGKTTTLRTLAKALTAEGRHVAVHFSCERAAPTGDDYGAAQVAILQAMRTGAELLQLEPPLMPPDPWPEADDASKLSVALRAWAEKSPLPLVLVFDEIDALQGQSLLSVLHQLRDGYPTRPGSFPASVVLCGLRDVREYKAASGGDPSRLGTASPFNVKVESLRIGDFSPEQVRELYSQHTDETGQEFTAKAVERAFEHSQGQPWLTNALANEIVRNMQIKAPEPITVDHVDQAKERLIHARATHLDSLVAKLHEPRVRRVLEPLIAGDLPLADETYNDDVTYVRDLGLVGPGRPVAVANPIYREVIVRVLGAYTEDVVVDDPRSFVLPDGRLDFSKLLHEFVAFWREHGDILERGTIYHEPAPQLVLMGYMHRIVNGGGYIDREYGVGRGRIDLLVRWPYADPTGKRVWQREAMELKVWHPGRPDPLDKGLQQIDEYLDRLGLDHGTLVLFDRRPEAPPLPHRGLHRDPNPHRPPSHHPPRLTAARTPRSILPRSSLDPTNVGWRKCTKTRLTWSASWAGPVLLSYPPPDIGGAARFPILLVAWASRSGGPKPGR